MEEIELVVVVKNGREMHCNPNGISELAKFGWAPKNKVAEEAEAKFKSLVDECKNKGIKVTAADTVETLTAKLSA